MLARCPGHDFLNGGDAARIAHRGSAKFHYQHQLYSFFIVPKSSKRRSLASR
jgi:hypothetical protein